MNKILVFSLLYIITSCSQVATTPKKIPRPSPFPRLETGIARICGVSQEEDGYEKRYIFNCKEDYSKDTRIAAGYGLSSKSGHPYTGVRSPYPRGKVARSIDMISRNHALNETYLYIIDFAGGPDSHDIKSVIYLLPRTDIPTVNVIGNEVELLLPTGERANFDAQTGAIKGGALKEGPVDLTKEYRKRRAPNVHYTGDYISIRLDHAYEEPTIGSAYAHVQQKDKSCTIARSKLFSRQGKLLTKSDDELVDVLNKECPGNSSFSL